MKYSRDLAKHNFYNGSKKGVAWCDIFVDWCFVEAYGVNAAYKLLCQPRKSAGAGCRYSADYYKSKKQWHTSSPQPGDQIFFWPSDHQAGDKAMQHTGLVVAVDSTYVYTVEGNTSSDSGVVWNGGSVNDKKYKLNYSRIAGYGRPNYNGVDPDDSPSESTNTELNNKEESAMTAGMAWVKVTKGDTVNFRQSPSTTAPKVKGMNKIPNGGRVAVMSSDDEWANVEYQGYMGYVMVEFLTQEPPVDSTPSASTDVMTVDEIVAEIS